MVNIHESTDAIERVATMKTFETYILVGRNAIHKESGTEFTITGVEIHSTGKRDIFIAPTQPTSAFMLDSVRYNGYSVKLTPEEFDQEYEIVKNASG